MPPSEFSKIPKEKQSPPEEFSRTNLSSPRYQFI